MSEATHDDLMQVIGRLEGRMESLGESITAMDGRLQSVEKMANMGRGALWMFLKIGPSPWCSPARGPGYGTRCICDGATRETKY